jgi:DNA primase
MSQKKKVLIVEGQIDALRLIQAGFQETVAAQGTALGQEHAKELFHLGVNEAHLAFDGDKAGQEAALKVGHILQKGGMEVKVVRLLKGQDPDLVLREEGPAAWQRHMERALDYLTFFVDYLSLSIDKNSPAGKNELVQTIVRKIQEWDHPLMVHESLRKLALLTQVPEAALLQSYESPSPIVVTPKGSLEQGSLKVDPDRVLEADLLRWLFLMGASCPNLVEMAKLYLEPKHFHLPVSRCLYEGYLKAHDEQKSTDLLEFAMSFDQPDQQLFLSEVLQKRVNRERVKPCFRETLQRILERQWMQERETIKVKIYGGRCSESEVLELAKEFDRLKKQRPEVKG